MIMTQRSLKITMSASLKKFSKCFLVFLFNRLQMRLFSKDSEVTRTFGGFIRFGKTRGHGLSLIFFCRSYIPNRDINVFFFFIYALVFFNEKKRNLKKRNRKKRNRKKKEPKNPNANINTKKKNKTKLLETTNRAESGPYDRKQTYTHIHRRRSGSR
jgi:hypothetical protein